MGKVGKKKKSRTLQVYFCNEFSLDLYLLFCIILYFFLIHKKRKSLFLAAFQENRGTAAYQLKGNKGFLNVFFLKITF